MDLSTWLKGALHSGSTTRRSVEARAIYYAAGAAVISLLVSLFYFSGKPGVPIFGSGSIGVVSVALATLGSFIGYFYVAYQTRDRHVGPKHWRAIRFNLTTFALAFIHGTIVFLSTTAAFYLVQDAFTGLMLDMYASSVIVAAVAGVCSYVMYLAAVRITTLAISTALAGFLVAGTLVSMIATDDQYWWEMYLSSLGTGSGVSTFAFNVTLTIGGLVLVCIADLVANDFAKLRAKDPRYAHANVAIIRRLLMLTGVSLAGVGLFKFDVYPGIHNLAAGALVVLFLTLVIGLRWYVPHFSKAFFAFSYGCLGVLLACTYFYKGNGYFNLTAYEIVAFIIVFGWLVVFIRQLAAALYDEAPASI